MEMPRKWFHWIPVIGFMVIVFKYDGLSVLWDEEDDMDLEWEKNNPAFLFGWYFLQAISIIILIIYLKYYIQ